MPKPIIVANWKNHPSSLKEAAKILTDLSRKSLLLKKVSLFIAPPYPYMDAVGTRSKKFATLASQDIFFTPEGTHTGTVTPDILKSFGVKLSIVGHSERRELGETNEVVVQKIKTALASGITPLVCVGEKSKDRDGNHFEELREQLKMSLEGVRRKDDAGKIMIAYEPVWAIGKRAKDAMTPADLSQTVIFIKKVLTDIFDREAADKMPILYGGSVEPENAALLYKESGVRGFLVGHASLDGKSLIAIAESLV